MIIGIPGDATYANYREAREAFWETTVMWFLDYMRDELNAWVFPEQYAPRVPQAGRQAMTLRRNAEGMFVDYNVDDVPAMAYKRDKLWDRAQKSDFLTVDEKREMVGMAKYEPGDSPGSVIMVPSTEIPLGEEVPMDEEPMPGDGPPAAGDEDQKPKPKPEE